MRSRWSGIGPKVDSSTYYFTQSPNERRPDPAVYVQQPLPPAADPAWFSPPVEHTLLDADAGDGVTEVTRLPPPEVDATAERPPLP